MEPIKSTVHTMKYIYGTFTLKISIFNNGKSILKCNGKKIKVYCKLLDHTSYFFFVSLKSIKVTYIHSQLFSSKLRFTI